jgi:carbonic anhydrase
MALSDLLTTRNATFVENGFDASLRMMPILKSIVIGCVDPRVDPTAVLATGPGEVAAIRNVGGRVTPQTLDELAMLRKVTRAAGGDFGPAWELIVLQHTDCGITRLDGEHDMLGAYFGVDSEALPAKALLDPRRAIELDVAAILADPRLAGVRASGLIFDVATGTVETVVEP